MNVVERLNELMKKQGLTDYQLAKLSGLSTSTIANMRKRNTTPTVPTLESICEALNISLSQFFADDASVQAYPITLKQKRFLDYYVQLSEKQQDLLFEIVLNMRNENNP